MLRCCRKGKIDLILTKSVSRFGRNTLDSLRALQELQVLGVDVYFEAEKLWLHDRQMQVLMTAYVAFAQAESEGASQSIRWGIKEGFRSGRSGYAEFACFGYMPAGLRQKSITLFVLLIVCQIMTIFF